jgi:hypothetical protein
MGVIKSKELDGIDACKGNFFFNQEQQSSLKKNALR